ncbi:MULTISPECIES: hypothetical protein [Bartonella]|nr:hypothetical protein [Bartonella choladocola]
MNSNGEQIRFYPVFVSSENVPFAFSVSGTIGSGVCHHHADRDN